MEIILSVGGFFYAVNIKINLKLPRETVLMWIEVVNFCGFGLLIEKYSFYLLSFANWYYSGMRHFVK